MFRAALAAGLLCLSGTLAAADDVRISPETDAFYKRSLHYGGWRKVSGECYDVRGAVLIEESVVEVEFEDTSSGRCKVVAGEWHDLCSGDVFTDAGEMDIDHLVPLKEAHQSGAFTWSQEKRREYANSLDEPEHLMAVSASCNRSKGDRDPAEWLPPNEAFHCEYVELWLAVKARWDLTMDQAEAEAIDEVLAGCD